MSEFPHADRTPAAEDVRRVNSRFLRSYLGDHIAVAAGVGGLARRMATAPRWEEHRVQLGRLVEVLGEDERDLQRVLTDRGIRPVRAVALLARFAELPGRLKANGRLVRSSPLTPLVELDGLRLGVAACMVPWRALVEVGVDPARAAAADARLRREHDALESLHSATATAAFAD